MSCRGIYGPDCFLGWDLDLGWEPYYFETPTFIYFQVFQVIVELMNIFFIGYTVKKIHETFKNKDQLRYGNIVLCVSMIYFKVSITKIVITMPATLSYQHYGKNLIRY